MFYLISDFIMLSLVFASYLFYKQALLRYARFKFIVTSILVILNYLLLGYGAYIVSDLPTEMENHE